MKTTIIRAIISFAILLFGSLLLVHTVLADEPPKSIVDEINATAQPMGEGSCVLDAMDGAAIPCFGFVDMARRLIWVALMPRWGDGDSFISHIFILREDGSEELRWCDPSACK